MKSTLAAQKERKQGSKSTNGIVLLGRSQKKKGKGTAKEHLGFWMSSK